MPGAFSLLIMTCLLPSASLLERGGGLSFELKTHFLISILFLPVLLQISFPWRGLRKMLFLTVCLICYYLNSEISNSDIELRMEPLMRIAISSTGPGSLSRSVSQCMDTSPPWARVMTPFQRQPLHCRPSRPI